jgi:Helix-turn-helix domain
MRRTRTLWEVFVLRFEEAMERYRKRRLTAEEAGELLGMSGRHFRRLLRRYDEDGTDGLRDRRLGKRSLRRAPPTELTRMQILYQERYRVTRLALQAAGLVGSSSARRRASQKARAPAAAWHAFVPGRFDPSLRITVTVYLSNSNYQITVRVYLSNARFACTYKDKQLSPNTGNLSGHRWAPCSTVIT